MLTLIIAHDLFNLLPLDKIFDQTNLKHLQTINVTKIIVSLFDRVENIVQAISPFPTIFLKGFCPRPVKRCHCVGMG